MNPTDPHPEQVRSLLAEAAAVCTSPWERQRVENFHREVMGLIEEEHRASELAARHWLEDDNERENK